MGTVKSKISAFTWVILVLTYALTVVTLYLKEYIGAIGGALLFLGALWDITRAHTDELAGVIVTLDKHVTDWTNNTKTVQHTEERLKNEHERAEERLKSEHEKIIQILSDMSGLERSIQAIAKLAQKTPILQDYLEWLRARYAKLLELPSSDGVIMAPEPDYFTFAAIFLGKAQKSVRSTSLVDPHWYDSYECEKYIQDQIKNLINKGTTFTRYFIVNPRDDTTERRQKTVSVIKNQAREGFVVVVVHTTNYASEIDAAVIDDDLLWVRAEVPNQDHMTLPGVITGCACYFRRVSANTNSVSELEGYFAQLDSRIHRTFSKSDFSSVDQQAVYG
jgi:hypothetical protein